MGKREGEGEGEDAHSRWLTISEWLLQRARDWPTSMYPWWASRENPLSLTGISRVPTSWLRMISPAVWLIWDSPLWAGGRGSPRPSCPLPCPGGTWEPGGTSPPRSCVPISVIPRVLSVRFNITSCPMSTPWLWSSGRCVGGL